MIEKLKKEQLLIGVLLGILLLVILIPVPGEKEKKESPETTAEVYKLETEENLEAQLKNVLQKIAGVGEVELFITYKDDGKMIIEKDESISEELVQEADGSGGTRTTTTNQKELQTVYAEGDFPYVIQELTPTVEGVLVVAEGAGNVSVKKQIQEAIEALFGLDAHKISIMKMEVSR